MQNFDFIEAFSNETLDYNFVNSIETTRIELKYEINKGSLLTTDKVTHPANLYSREAIQINQHSIETSNLELKTILYYAGHIIAVYSN